MSLVKEGVHKTALGAAVAIALMLGVAIGCTGAPGRTSGAQGPGSSSKEFPNALLEVLTKLVTKDIPDQPDLAVKYLLLSDALANLDFKAAGKATVEQLTKSEDFVQTEQKKPEYFNNPFNPHTIKVNARKGRYDYATQGGTWVDYAAVNLGGGAFHNGFKQEETMTLEMPQLANVVAQGEHYTRGKGCPEPSIPKVLQCSPTPLFIGPVHRTISIDSKLAEEWDKATFHRDEAFALIGPLSNNVKLNVLAVAVSSLEGVKNLPVEQTAQNTIDDLFNSLVAGFTLAKEQKVTEVNTGGIGTGVFKNSTKVVYAMQKLAAAYVGVTLNYYGIDPKTEQTPWDAVVEQIQKAYNQSSTKTVKHLLELAHDILK